MHQTILTVIIVLHVAFILFVILTPFIGDERLLILHIITIPFMMAHWYVNDNTCALTLLENHVRYRLNGEKPKDDEIFMYKLIAPIYDFKKNNDDISGLIYIITIGLWLFACYKLYSSAKSKNVKRLQDIFILLGGASYYSQRPSTILVDSEK